RCTQDISTAGTHSMPASPAASTASWTPATASWSVSDMTVTPASAAARATSAGSSWPSETVEWAWRSTILSARDCRVSIVDSYCDNWLLRISAKADYAVRAALEL